MILSQLREGLPNMIETTLLTKVDNDVSYKDLFQTIPQERPERSDGCFHACGSRKPSVS